MKLWIRLRHSKEAAFVVCTAFFLALIQLKLKLHYTPAWADGVLAGNHEKLLGFLYTNNEQSRVLQFYVPEFFHRLFGISVPAAYSLQRILFTTAGYACFHFYLRKWFDAVQALAGMALVAAVVPLTYKNELQESCNLLFLTFTLALWAIRERKHWASALILAIGALNNETILVLGSSLLFWEARKISAREMLLALPRTLAIFSPAIGATAVIRYITRDRPHLGGAWHLGANWDGIVGALKSPLWFWHEAWWLDFFFLFGALWVFAFTRFREKPEFLRRAAICIPFFMAAHLVTGVVYESRQMVPLAALLIPMALHSLKDARSARASKNAVAPRSRRAA